MGDIEVRLGDITREGVEAIVTIVNEPQINEVIHRAAGPRLAAAVAEAGPLEPGEAIATPAFGLWPVKHVIHTVGPEGGHDEDLVLTNCYINSIVLAADELAVESVAFPVVGPVEIAAIAVRSLPIVDLIRLVAADQHTYEALTVEVAKPIVELCPTCGADAIPFVIGRPGPDLQAAADMGLVRLGGCFSQGEDVDPQWSCTKDSSHYWTNGRKDDRRQHAAMVEAAARIPER